MKNSNNVYFAQSDLLKSKNSIQIEDHEPLKQYIPVSSYNFAKFTASIIVLIRELHPRRTKPNYSTSEISNSQKYQQKNITKNICSI